MKLKISSTALQRRCAPYSFDLIKFVNVKGTAAKNLPQSLFMFFCDYAETVMPSTAA